MTEDTIDCTLTAETTIPVTLSVSNVVDTETEEIVIQCSLISSTSSFSVTMISNTIEVSIVSTPVPVRLSDLADDSTHRLVTDAEKESWNNKADSEDIPTALSQLTDDATHRLVSDTEKSDWSSRQTAQQVSTSIAAVTDPIAERVTALENLLEGWY